MTGHSLLPSAYHDGIGTPDYIAYATRYPAYTRPCQRFADALADVCAHDSGSVWIAYPSL